MSVNHRGTPMSEKLSTSYCT